MPKVKVDLSKAAKQIAEDIKENTPKVTQEILLAKCPKDFLPLFKKAKDAGDRADLLKDLDDRRKEIQNKANEIEEFQSTLKQWFIQELPSISATGVTGKRYRVEITNKERVNVLDWPKFYAWVVKNKAFEFFERKVKLSAAQDRWNAGKQVPGLEKFTYKSISLTKK